MQGSEQLGRRTIDDFGEQWTRYRDNDGYYASTRLLGDITEPLLPVSEIRGMRVADIGSGTGRIVNMLLDAGAQHASQSSLRQHSRFSERTSAMPLL